MSTKRDSGPRKRILRRPNAPPQHRRSPVPRRQVRPIDIQHAISDTPHASQAGILALQKAGGNLAVSRLIQRQLTVGPAGDRYEREADRVAEKVMAMGASAALQSGTHVPSAPDVRRQANEAGTQATPLAATITPLVQRQDEEELQEKPLVQRQDEEELQEKPLVQRQDEEELQEKPLVQRQDEEELQEKPLVQRQDEEELQEKPLVQRQDEEELQEKPLVQRQDDEEGEDLQEKPLVRRQKQARPEHRGRKEAQMQPRAGGGFRASASVEQRLASQKGKGSPLPEQTRALMEPRFGADFGGVRIHTDSEAVQLARGLKAQAFTHGRDVYFGAGRYDPGSSAGKRLLAHELTHTIQQTGSAQQKPAISRARQGTIQRNLFSKLFGKKTPTRPAQDWMLKDAPAPFTPGGIHFASVSDGKVGSIYFEDARLRLTHRSGPQVSSTHRGIWRFAVPPEIYHHWRRWKKRTRPRPGFFDNLLYFKRQRCKEAAPGAKGKLVEIWPPSGSHPSRGSPKAFRWQLPQEKLNIIYNIANRYDKDTAGNTVLYEVMKGDPILKKIPINKL